MKKTSVFIVALYFTISNLLCETHAFRKSCIYIDYKGKQHQENEVDCQDNDICNKTFNISYVLLHPYYLHQAVQDMLIKCCSRRCAKYQLVNLFTNISEVSPSSINSSDFVYPFLASSTTLKLHGYYFIPVMDVPYLLYITKEREGMLFKSIMGLSPAVIICLMMAMIAGFLAWVLETWQNKDEFPRQFLSGWFEGVWWSFISMTTVGYGDKTPKTIAARLFSVAWIFTGITVFGLLTGSLTTDIMAVNTPPTPELKGMKIGALQYRQYDAYVIATYGGIIVESRADDFYSDLFQLIDMLQKNDIDGILLDKYTLWFISYLLTGDIPNSNETNKLIHENSDKIEYFLNQTIQMEKRYQGEKLSYGILVKHIECYEYFRHAVIDNRFHNEMLFASYFNDAESEHKSARQRKGKFDSVGHTIFSPSGRYFKDCSFILSGMIVGICLFGIFYEIMRKRNEKEKQPVTSDV